MNYLITCIIPNFTRNRFIICLGYETHPVFAYHVNIIHFNIFYCVVQVCLTKITLINSSTRRSCLCTTREKRFMRSCSFALKRLRLRKQMQAIRRTSLRQVLRQQFLRAFPPYDKRDPFYLTSHLSFNSAVFHVKQLASQCLSRSLIHHRSVDIGGVVNRSPGYSS